jgi:glycine/D-amino acid oxidase-like deaminating enzyme
MKPRNRIEVDVVVVGGGIAGLWVLDRLVTHGVRAALIEASALGDGQTVASQGMIHGGLKYALGGQRTSAHDAIAAMPARWRACLDGRGDVDLRGVRTLSDRYYLWSNATALGRLGAFLASRVLRGRVERLRSSDYPAAFAGGFAGSLYALDEPVLDVRSLLGCFGARHAARIARTRVEPADLRLAHDGSLDAIVTADVEARAQAFVFAAGAGNEVLARAIPGAPAMQRRPLRQTVVRGPALPELFAHCVSVAHSREPLLTITTHPNTADQRIWCVGGALATAGAALDSPAHAAAARKALVEYLPWLDLGSVDVESFLIDRAEPANGDGTRPDDACALRTHNAIFAWPTKLALAPRLGDRVLAALPAIARGSAPHAPAQDGAPIADPPWR